MSIFEYDREWEEELLRKEEFEAGRDTERKNTEKERMNAAAQTQKKCVQTQKKCALIMRKENFCF